MFSLVRSEEGAVRDLSAEDCDCFCRQEIAGEDELMAEAAE